MTNLELLHQELTIKASDSVYAGKTLVFGEGKLNALIAMIGEAPGGDEEKQGHPFVGKAGKNLTEFLEFIGLARDEIFISNVVKLRPTKQSPKTGKPVNRPPTNEEISFFLPFLISELEIAAPKIIVTLGNVPLKAILADPLATIGSYHGKVHKNPQGQLIFALYHPASMIYNPAIRQTYMEDLEALKIILSTL